MLAEMSITCSKEHGRPSSSSLVTVRPVSSHPPRLLLRRPRGSRRRDVVRVGGRRRGDEGAPRGGRRAAWCAPRGPSRRGDGGARRFRARLTTIAPPRGPRPLAGDVLRVLRHPPRARRRRPSAPGPRGSRTRTTSGATPPTPSSTTRRIARAPTSAPLFFVRRLGRHLQSPPLGLRSSSPSPPRDTPPPRPNPRTSPLFVTWETTSPSARLFLLLLPPAPPRARDATPERLRGARRVRAPRRRPRRALPRRLLPSSARCVKSPPRRYERAADWRDWDADVHGGPTIEFEDPEADGIRGGARRLGRSARRVSRG